jgi:hypothetical protein
MESGADKEEPEPLQDLLTRLVIADATFRKERDAFIAGCRDHLHYALQQVGPIDPKLIHSVINIMDDFLNHRSRK